MHLVSVHNQALSSVEFSVAVWAFVVLVLLVLHKCCLVTEEAVTVEAPRLVINPFLLFAHC